MILPMRSWFVVFLIPSIAAAGWKVIDRQESNAGISQAFVITISNGSNQAKIYAVAGRASELPLRVVNNVDRRFCSVQETVSQSEAIDGADGRAFAPGLSARC